MPHVDDPTTLGRARLSFANEAEIDEFVATLERYERGRARRPTSGAPSAWCAAPTASARPSDAQMLRVKIPQGILDGAAARRAGRRGRDLLARLRPHHHAPERAVPLREAARRRDGDAPAGRGRAHHARGLRQLGAQHHRLPVRRRGGGRGVRRHAVRGGADALPAAPSARLRRCRASSRSPSRAAPTTTRCTAINDLGWRARVADREDGRAARLPRDRRRRHRRSCRASGAAALRVPARGRDPGRGRGRAARLPRPRRLQAQAAQPHEVPDPDSAGTRGARSSRRALGEVQARGRHRAARSIPSARRSRRAAAVARPPPTIRAVARARRAAELRGPGLAPGRRPALPMLERRPTSAGRARTCGPQKQAGYALVDRHAAARRRHRRASCACSPTSREPYGDGTVRTTARPGPVFRWVRIADVPDAVSPPGRGGPGPAGRAHARGRDELPGRRVLPPRGHAVARPRARCSATAARAARPRRRGARARHQDQRLPERLRPAPHRGPRLPGQRAPGGGKRRCRSTS